MKAIIIIGLLFFIFGFLTWVNGTLIAFFKKAFNLNNTGSYLVTFAYYISYTLMAIPSSIVLKKFGFKNGMAIGMLIMAIGCLLFVPAAKLTSYFLFLTGVFTTGIGLTLIQTAVNPYITVLGPKSSAAQRISLMGFANKTGGISSQVILGSILLSSVATSVPINELDKVITPYFILFLFFLILAFLLKNTKYLPEINEDEKTNTEKSKYEITPKNNILQFPNLVFGVMALFCAGGVEVIAIDTIISYGISIGFKEEEAMLFGSYVLFSMILGYLSGTIFIPKFISQENYLKWSGIVGGAITILAIFTFGFTSVLFIAALGFVNAIMWPAIWPLALDGLGKFIKIGAALLIMSVCSGALIPLIYGFLADTIHSTQSAYWLLIPLYAFVTWYASKGHKIKNWQQEKIAQIEAQ